MFIMSTLDLTPYECGCPNPFEVQCVPNSRGNVAFPYLSFRVVIKLTSKVHGRYDPRLMITGGIIHCSMSTE